MSTEEKGFSRRSLLKKAAVGTAGIAGAGILAACGTETVVQTEEVPVESQATVEAPVESTGTPSFLVAPDPVADADIAETVEADIVIVGCGVAGLAAARAASEQGVTVAVIEKGETYQYRSGQYGINGSTIQKENGMEFDGSAAVGDLMKEMGYRPDQRIWNYWRDFSGEAFDWLLKPATDQGLVDFKDMFATSYDATKITLQPLHFPAPEGYDPSKEYSPTYPPATMAFIPNQGAILEMSYQICVTNGVDFHFSTWARQLIRPNKEGRVQGVIAQDLDGKYIKFVANKAVILAAGDYGSNADMVKYYCGGRTYNGFFSNVDAAGNVTNMGEGQQMGIWAGAHMEDGPHAPMTHTLGSALGVDSFLMLNTSGERFMNEDVAGQQLSTQLYRQKDQFAWVIFDDLYPDQVEKMGVSHGAVNHIVDESVNPHLDGAQMTIGRTGVSSRTEVEENAVKADTLEELLAQLELSEEAQAKALESIAHYNELCANGKDTDYNKVSTRMFPVSTAPFYASKISAGAMLVCLGGLSIEPVSLKVVDDTFQPIEGLYAAGNNMGGRIVQDYPVTIAGVSHATALTFGYLVGKKAATAA